MQVTDPAASFGDRLTFDLQDQPQYTVSRRVLGSHVDDDALAGVTAACGLDDLLPVLTHDGNDGFGAAALIGWSANHFTHQL